MSGLPWSVAELLPHGGAMILLDDALGEGKGWVETGVQISEDSMLYEPGLGVPAWVGIEYMAQTVALYSGIQAKRAGTDIKIGFLLGTRHYDAMTDYFPLGGYLRIHAREAWQDGQMAVFDCRIESAACLATARINLYQPDDVTTVIQRGDR